MAYIGANTNYKILTNTDIGAGLVTVEYLLDTYPSLANSFKTAGLWVWGENSSGQLGTNDLTHYSSPVQTVAGGTNWKQVSASSSTISGIKTDGTLWSWGLGSLGCLGDNTTTSKSSPVQTVAGGTNWKQVSTGFSISIVNANYQAAIKTDGTLWTWGANLLGALGDNTTTSKSSPVQTVSAGTNWKQISTGTGFMLAVKTDGTLWAWGNNTIGQLGDNSIIHRSSPVQTVAGGTNWKYVSAGDNVSAAIKTDGTLWLWGMNSQGELGDNTTTSKSSPVQTVSAGTNWKQVAVGTPIVAAIKTDGTLWTWGNNTYGQLGDNTTTSRSSPVQTVAAGTNWKQVSTGLFATAAIKNDGSLWTWGLNGPGAYGQLGTNDSAHRSSPVQTVSGGGNWRQVSFGRYKVATIRDDSVDPF